MKKIVRICLVLLIFNSIFTGVIENSIYSKAATSKKTLEENYQKAKEEVSRLKKDVKVAQSKYDEARKGTVSLFGDIISYNPLVVSQVTLTGKNYYWVTNTGNIEILLNIASGNVIPTGNYRTYNGITCVECTAVKISPVYWDNLEKAKQKLKEKKKQANKYKGALNDKPIFYDKKIQVSVGEKGVVSYFWKNGGDYNKVIWKSSNPSVVKANSNGILTAKKPGTAVISAKSNISGYASKLKIIVINDKVSKFTLKETELELDMNEVKSYQLEWTIIPNNVTITEKSFKSSDNSIASVDNNGLITPRSPGNCTITCTINGVKAVCNVKIIANVKEIELEAPWLSGSGPFYFEKGEKFRIGYSVEPYYIDEVQLEWSSKTPNVAVVTPDGEITVVSKGTAIISARADNGVEATITFEIRIDGEDDDYGDKDYYDDDDDY